MLRRPALGRRRSSSIARLSHGTAGRSPASRADGWPRIRGPLGPASVVEFAGIPAVAEQTRKLFALTGMHGLVGTQFIVARDSGIPHLIEVNRRMLPATHSGSLVGVDLAAALFATVTGAPWRGPADLAPGRGLRLALFPQEWYRDAASAWLQSLPSDAPWHDPDLLTAMLRLPFPAA
jgi:hypothetical protein